MKVTEKLIETIERYVDRLYGQRHIPDYIVEIYDEEDMMEYEYRQDFTKEEIDEIMSLKEKYGVPGFVKYLIDVFKNEAFLYDVAHGCEIQDIRYKDKQKEADIYPIRFSRYDYDGDLKQHPFSICMPKGYYARLLRHCIVNPGLCYNMVEQIDPGLHQWLQGEIWKNIYEEGRQGPVLPFLIMMDQASADALELVKTLDAKSTI